jgi:hypothetical protein
VLDKFPSAWKGLYFKAASLKPPDDDEATIFVGITRVSVSIWAGETCRLVGGTALADTPLGSSPGIVNSSSCCIYFGLEEVASRKFETF